MLYLQTLNVDRSAFGMKNENGKKRRLKVPLTEKVRRGMRANNSITP